LRRKVVALPRGRWLKRAIRARPRAYRLPLRPARRDTTARIIAETRRKLVQRFYVEKSTRRRRHRRARTVISSPRTANTLFASDQLARDQRLAVCQAALHPLKAFGADFKSRIFRFHLLHGAATDFKTLADFIAAATAKPGNAHVGTSISAARRTCRPNCSRPRPIRFHHRFPTRHARGPMVALLQGNMRWMTTLFCDSRATSPTANSARLGGGASSGPVRSESTPLFLPSCRKADRQLRCRLWNALFAARTHAAVNRDTLNRALQDILARRAEIADRRRIDARASTPEESRAGSNPISTKWRQVSRSQDSKAMTLPILPIPFERSSPMTAPSTNPRQWNVGPCRYRRSRPHPWPRICQQYGRFPPTTSTFRRIRQAALCAIILATMAWR